MAFVSRILFLFTFVLEVSLECVPTQCVCESIDSTTMDGSTTTTTILRNNNNPTTTRRHSRQDFGRLRKTIPRGDCLARIRGTTIARRDQNLHVSGTRVSTQYSDLGCTTWQHSTQHKHHDYQVSIFVVSVVHNAYEGLNNA